MSSNTTSLSKIKFFSPTMDACLSHTQVICDYFNQYRVTLHKTQSLRESYLKWPNPIEPTKRLAIEGCATRSKRLPCFINNNGDDSDDDFDLKTKKARLNEKANDEDYVPRENPKNVPKSSRRTIERTMECTGVETDSENEEVVKIVKDNFAVREEDKENYFNQMLERDDRVVKNTASTNEQGDNAKRDDSEEFCVVSVAEDKQMSENKECVDDKSEDTGLELDKHENTQSVINLPNMFSLSSTMDNSSDSDFVVQSSTTRDKVDTDNRLNEINALEADLVPPVFESPSKTLEWSLFSENENEKRSPLNDKVNSEPMSSLRKRKFSDARRLGTAAFDRIFHKKSRTEVGRNSSLVTQEASKTTRNVAETVVLSDDEDVHACADGNGATSKSGRQDCEQEIEELPDLDPDTETFEKVSCPLCGQSFSQQYIERHAARCQWTPGPESPEIEVNARHDQDTHPGQDQGQSAMENCILCEGKFLSGHDMETHFDTCFSSRMQNSKDRVQRTSNRLLILPKRQPVPSCSNENQAAFSSLTPSGTDSE